MRPPVGGDALSRSRKHSLADHDVTTPLAQPGNGTPTTFFMASESMLDRSIAGPVAMGSESNFGVQSLEETVEDASPDRDAGEEQGHLHRRLSNRRPSTITDMVYGLREASTDSLSQASACGSSDSSPPRSQQQYPQTSNLSQPLTPVSFGTPAPGSSLPSSPKSSSTRSFRHSDEESIDDGNSQAIASGGEEETDPLPPVQHGALQLIMPSIKMPSRRPFTERGRSMGRLKILLAGDSGVGKTSLIKSIVQTCEDIVHVDPLSSTSPSIETLPSRNPRGKMEGSHFRNTKQITEVYASTRAYPSWWSEFEESKILRRRKSMGDTVLERNLCFVDTPGYSQCTSILESMDDVIRYIESQMRKAVTTSNMTDSDLLSFLGGSGGSQVDVVLYLISNHMNATDIEFLRRLSLITNVIPLITKSDTLFDREVQELKSSIMEEIRNAEIRPFTFTSDFAATNLPYTVCSAPSGDEENMDASLLMSPDYVQPLLPSELALLVENLFEKESISWVRHSAAKKVIQWLKVSNNIPQSLSPAGSASTLIPIMASSTSSTPSTALSTLASQNRLSHQSPLSYRQARIADHIQREERLAQVHLANWAGELQRSLQNERVRYEALARGERTVWLMERLDECVKTDSALAIEGVPSSSALREKALMSLRAASPRSLPRRGLADPADPLGLVRWNETMKRRGWVAFQVVGSFGILGAVAIWIARSWDIGMDGSIERASGWFGNGE